MDNTQPGGQGVTEVINQLTNISRQLSVWSQSMTNAQPAATTTSSPKFTAVTLGTTASVVIGTSTIRHGMLLHNPGTTSCYIYQTGMSPTPTTTALGGTILIAAGSTLPLPSSSFANINVGFSGFVLAGSSQPFTVVEFF